MPVDVVTAKRKDGPEVRAEFDFGSDINDMLKKFGPDITFNHAKGSLRVSFQGWLRSQLDQKKTQAEITAASKNWKPGVRKQGKSPAEKIREALAKMNPDERAAVLKDYKPSSKAA